MGIVMGMYAWGFRWMMALGLLMGATWGGYQIWASDTYQRHLYPERYWYLRYQTVTEAIQADLCRLRELAQRWQHQKEQATREVARMLRSGVSPEVAQETFRQRYLDSFRKLLQQALKIRARLKDLAQEYLRVREEVRRVYPGIDLPDPPTLDQHLTRLEPRTPFQTG